MNIRTLAGLTVAVLALTIPATLAAQKMYGATKYDKSAEVTVKGTIRGIERHQGENKAIGLHLSIESARETIEVHVAPVTYMDQEGIKFTLGQEVSIVGSKVPFNEAKVIVAREITTPTRTIVLRDKDGKPAWEANAANVR